MIQLIYKVRCWLSCVDNQCELIILSNNGFCEFMAYHLIDYQSVRQTLLNLN